MDQTENNVEPSGQTSDVSEAALAAAMPDAPPLPSYKFYITFKWEIKKGKRSGEEGVFINLTVPEITTEQQINSIRDWLIQSQGYDHVTLHTPFLQLEA